MSSFDSNTSAGKPDQGDGPFAALPPIDINEVIGVCEIVQEHGCRVDLYDLVRELGDLKLIVPAVEGARVLGFVKIRNGETVLTPLGRAWTQANPQERQRLLHDQMASLKMIRWVRTTLSNSGAAIPKDELLKQFCARFTAEDAPATFWTVVNWGTFAQIFQYEQDRQALTLRS